jgi:hypothetical protein
MINSIKKRWILLFLFFLVLGFVVGYSTMTFEFYNGKRSLENKQNFWQTLSPI